MNIRRRILTSLTGVAASLCVAGITLANGTLVRWHKMGEEEGGTNNSTLSTTLDTPVDGGDFVALDLSAANSPVYRTITGRPDGGTGVGIEFSAASSRYLTGYALNWPQNSPLDQNLGGQLNLTGIDNRGFQLWVRPTSTAAQSIVMDTNQHGVRINSNGKFSMRYANADYDSTVTAVANTWYHIEVVRPAGIPSSSRLYINGNAAAVSAPVDYPSDASNMAVGSNVTLDGEYFSGVMDDLRMYVYGTTTAAPLTNYGTWGFTTDNSFVASPVTGLKGVLGDVTNDGSFTASDKSAFIAGWMYKNLVSGVQIGDMFSHSKGDLNLDGITNIQDLLLMQNALAGAGIGTITAADLSVVPEPSTLVLVLFGAFLVLDKRKRVCRVQVSGR